MIAKWLDVDSIEYVVASTYASGKGRLFELFFGWRRTNKFNMAQMVFSKKDWIRIDEMVCYYYTFCVKNT